VYLLSIRDFQAAAQLFLDTLATFTSTELMSYKTFVFYACLSSALTLGRPDFKTKVVNAPEVLEVIHEIPDLSNYVNSLYNCNYVQFFSSLGGFLLCLGKIFMG
jgi:26S proteasome regulatory subunit N7